MHPDPNLNPHAAMAAVTSNSLNFHAIFNSTFSCNTIQRNIQQVQSVNLTCPNNENKNLKHHPDQQQTTHNWC